MIAMLLRKIVAATVIATLALPLAVASIAQSYLLTLRHPQVTLQNVDILSTAGGLAGALTLAGNYAYLTVGLRLDVLDISNRAQPRLVGSLALSSVGSTMVISGSHAYIVGAGSLMIAGIADPTRPTLEAVYGTSDRRFDDVALVGRYAYISYSTEPASNGERLTGLLIVDVANPRVPTLISDTALPGWPLAPTTLAVSGATLYFSRGELNSGTFILDVADPTAVASVGRLNIDASDILVQGSRAYMVSTSSSRLSLFDIANPQTPLAAGSLANAAPSGGWALALEGNLLYIIAQRNGNSFVLQVIDIGAAQGPRVVGTQPWLFDAKSIAVADGYTYISGDRLRLLDVTNPAQQKDLSATATPAPIAYQANDLVAAGDYLYLGTPRGLQIVNRRDPRLPLIGSLATERPVYMLAVAGEHAYLIQPRIFTGTETLDGLVLNVVRVDMPAQPALVSSLILPDMSGIGEGFPVNLIVEQQRLYVVNGIHVSRIIDIANPLAPRIVGHFGPQPCAGTTNVAVVGFLVYQHDCEEINGQPPTHYLLVRDFSDPAAPREVARLSLAGRIAGLARTGTHLYVILTNGQLFSFDIRQPASPRQLAAVSLKLSGKLINEFVPAGDQLYVSSIDELEVLDISLPESPLTVGGVVFDGRGIGNSMALAASGDTVYLHNPFGSLFALRFSGLSIEGRVLQANRQPFAGANIGSSAGQLLQSDVSGTFRLDRLARGSYTLTPTLQGYSFWPPTRTLTLPPNSSQSDFFVLPLPVTTSVAAGTGATLSYSDTQGLTTSLSLAAGTLTEAVTLALTPTLADSYDDQLFAGHAFELRAQAEQLGQLEAGLPLSLTISYSDADLSVADEQGLTLRRWSGTGWQDVALGCGQSAYNRDLANNRISLALCGGGRYALFGPTLPLRMPVLMR